MKTNFWMPLYIGDYLRDTQHLPRESHGSYLLLLMAYWNNQGPLRDDDPELATIARCGLAEWTLTERSRLSKFFVVGSGAWRHNRMDREISKAASNSESRKRGAKLANEAKSRKKHAQAMLKAPSASGNDNADGHAGGVAHGSPNAPPSHSPSDLMSLQEVEYPPGFPKTEAEAECAAAAVGCGADFAAQVWNKAAGRGGADARDVPVRSWPHYLRTEWVYEQERREKEKTNGNNNAGRVGRGSGKSASRNEGTLNRTPEAYRDVGKVE